MDEIETKPGSVDSKVDASVDAPVAGTPEADNVLKHVSFLLIVQDDPENPGQVNVAGTRHPPQFIPGSPAHIIGQYLQDHMADILVAAAGYKPPPPADEVKVIGERERTILLPAGA